MKYSIIGLGAVGSVIGGMLANSGEEIILIGKTKQINNLKNNGLKIKNKNKYYYSKPIVSDNFSDIINSDVIFICVKSQDTRNLVKKLKKFVNKTTLFVSVQNGIRNSSIIKEETGNEAISSIVLFNALYKKSGEVIVTLPGGLILEHKDEKSELIAESFNKAGLTTILVDNIQGYIWSKLILNLQIAITAITGQTIVNSIENKYSRKIIIRTIEEGINIIENSGIELKTLPNIDPKRVVKKLRFLNSFLIKIGKRFTSIDKNAINSMLQSINRGKTTEIEFINGEIIKLANNHNFKAPINSKLVELVNNDEIKNNTKKIKPIELARLLNI
jgi:2-dehydropantoate 2-reductase